MRTFFIVLWINRFRWIKILVCCFFRKSIKKNKFKKKKNIKIEIFLFFFFYFFNFSVLTNLIVRRIRIKEIKSQHYFSGALPTRLWTCQGKFLLFIKWRRRKLKTNHFEKKSMRMSMLLMKNRRRKRNVCWFPLIYLFHSAHQRSSHFFFILKILGSPR